VLTESFATDSSYVVTGKVAIFGMVGEYGFGGYIAILFPWFILSVIAIFIGSVTTAVWLRNNA
jgi:hypothetical protein